MRVIKRHRRRINILTPDSCLEDNAIMIPRWWIVTHTCWFAPILLGLCWGFFSWPTWSILPSHSLSLPSPPHPPFPLSRSHRTRWPRPNGARCSGGALDCFKEAVGAFIRMVLISYPLWLILRWVLWHWWCITQFISCQLDHLSDLRVYDECGS